MCFFFKRLNIQSIWIVFHNAILQLHSVIFSDEIPCLKDSKSKQSFENPSSNITKTFWIVIILISSSCFVVNSDITIKKRITSKGSLTAKSFLLLLKYPKKCAKPLAWKKGNEKMLRRVIWHLFFWRFDAKRKLFWDSATFSRLHIIETIHTIKCTNRRCTVDCVEDLHISP